MNTKNNTLEVEDRQHTQILREQEEIRQVMNDLVNDDLFN